MSLLAKKLRTLKITGALGPFFSRKDLILRYILRTYQKEAQMIESQEPLEKSGEPKATADILEKARQEVKQSLDAFGPLSSDAPIGLLLEVGTTLADGKKDEKTDIGLAFAGLRLTTSGKPRGHTSTAAHALALALYHLRSGTAEGAVKAIIGARAACSYAEAARGVGEWAQ